MSSSCNAPAATGRTLDFVCFDGAPARAADFPLTIVPEFITAEEEARLVKYFHNTLRRHRYNYQHWDGVIVGYRELLVPYAKMPSDVAAVLRRVPDTFFHDPSRAMPEVHALDLAPDGHILRHVDSVKFSGDYVAGLCLASDAVMALHEQAASARGDGSEAGGYDDPGGEDEYTGQVVNMHLPRRSAYVLSGESRYNWAHEIVSDPDGRGVAFKGRHVHRERRISIMFRDEK